ncbi:MAG: 1-deoxy-D-xylulose-5-phosphate synthase [Planctomycetota bacterium]|jgi:1-deoxy-D-xylulose-5-phosphate synthase
MTDERILDRIQSPHQLRRLSDTELIKLAQEIRERIIEVVSRRGGHLASNLGVAELTIAMHHVFDFSHDRVLWDVGHQCYAHKLLTGRAKRFDSLRQGNGLSGFPAPSESPYDLFATGHAGTAISTATGMALADQTNNEDRKIVAVVGDASIVNGLSLEGINNVATMDRQLLIILNDNSMAIDRTQGALARALDNIRLTHTYGDLKHSAETLLQRMPMGEEIGEALRNLKEGLKITVHGRQVFEALGISYFGPVDGHDIHGLIRVLKRLADVDHPILLHVHTQKGRGCVYAVEDPCRFHSPSAYEHKGDKAVMPIRSQPTWTQVFSKTLVKLAEKNEKIVAITAAMPDGCGLVEFRKRFPDRYIDVGINESHAVAMAAGLAKGGLRPIVAIYSTFMQRAFDQVFEEISLQNLPVLLCMDRAGLVGSDGAVHHGFADIAYLRVLPGMVLMGPADAVELNAAMELALSLDGPAAIRYPRDEVPADSTSKCPPFELGKSRIYKQGDDGTFLCYGTMVEPALQAAGNLEREEGLHLGVINARFAKPLDATLITRLISSGKPMLICEDHAMIGGFGSAVMELAGARGLITSNVRLLGIPDRFISHAKRQEQLTEVGLDAANLSATMKEMVRYQSEARRYV